MANHASVAPGAFNVERVRAAMLEGVRVPPDLLQRAVDKLAEKLDAKHTKFFAFRGEVIQREEVEDHATQLLAVDKIAQMAGVYARNSDTPTGAPLVAMEMDPRTGVVRLVIGNLDGKESLPAVTLPTGDASVFQELPPVEEGLTIAPLQDALVVTAPPQEEVPEVIKIKRGTLPPGVHNALFGNDA